jgi:hypothetical protein
LILLSFLGKIFAVTPRGFEPKMPNSCWIRILDEKEPRMARPQHTHSLPYLEEVLTILFCLINEAYALLNPPAHRYEAIKRLSDSEVIVLTLFRSFGAWRANALSCGTPSGGSSLTCFRG